jgi:serine/threonine-protein kinase
VAKFKMDQASDTNNDSLTRTGSMLGSPMYMSPEQARGLKTIDHRADLWSMGIVISQLLTGRVPYQDIDGLGELIITICSEPPPLVSVHAPWVSQELAQVIAKALELATGDRYQSARDMGNALEACLDDAGDEGWRIRRAMIVPFSDDRLGPALPQVSVKSGDGSQGNDATMMIDGEAPSDTGTVALSPEELSEATATDRRESAGPADRTGSAASATNDGGVDHLTSRDERALRKHRQAQKTAMAAARLDDGAADGGTSWIVWVLLGALALAVGYLLVTRYVIAPPAQPTAPTQPAARTQPTAPTQPQAPAPSPTVAE